VSVRTRTTCKNSVTRFGAPQKRKLRQRRWRSVRSARQRSQGTREGQDKQSSADGCLYRTGLKDSACELTRSGTATIKLYGKS